MSRAINLLLAEDSDDDARLVVRTLQRAGLDVRHERIESAAAMAAALERQEWDVVISDYSMPGFSGLEALRILRSGGRDTPFILISGTAGEELAVDALKAGAGDYVLKKNLSRLPLVLERELAEAAVRRANRIAELDLRKLALAVRQSGTGIVITDAAGAIEFANPKFESMTGYSIAEVKGKNPRFLKSGLTSAQTYREIWECISAGKNWQGEIQNRKKSGEIYWEKQHISPVLDDAGRILNFIAVKEDVTEQKHMMEELAAAERRFRSIFDNTLAGVYQTTREGGFVNCNLAMARILGYASAAELMAGATDLVRDLYVDPGDRKRLVDMLNADGIVHGFEARFRRKDGSVIWVALTARLAHEAKGDKAYIMGMMQDVTGRKQAEDRIRRLNRIYAVLSGINSTIVRVSNREELFKETCRIAVEAGNFRAAWIGLVDRTTNTIEPVAWRGVDDDYIRAMPVLQLAASDSTAPGTLGPGPLAIFQKQPVLVADIAGEPGYALKDEAKDRGFRSLAKLPLMVSGEAVGVLALYAAETGFFDNDEMRLLNELAGDISFALDHLDKANRLDYLAYYDALTGLANRTLLHERLTQFLGATGQGESKLALVLLDVERFKSVNDSLGRQAGDELLKQLAARLGQAAGTGNVARTSGDHFAVILPVIKGRSEAERTVERIWRECFAQSFRVSGAESRLTAKSGVALFPGDGADAEALYAHAESALQQAKKTGERHVFHSIERTAGVANQFALENRLRLALENDEFVLHYQPKVDTETRRIAGVEALIRWQSPDLGLVPPMKFIPLMEETGLILEAGAWALKRAALDHRGWVEQGLAAPRVAVNVSAIQLRQRNFVASVEEAIIEGSAPTGIDLEITESLIMEDVQGSIGKLKAVRGLGVQIGIDDFGTGYSSLGYLAKLPVQTLKIDRSFIITMLDDPDTMTLVSTIISLAHSLRLTVVAEGVDAEDQAKMLRLLRCDQMQGYLFSKPVPVDQFTALLMRVPAGAQGSS